MRGCTFPQISLNNNQPSIGFADDVKICPKLRLFDFKATFLDFESLDWSDIAYNENIMQLIINEEMSNHTWVHRRELVFLIFAPF